MSKTSVLKKLEDRNYRKSSSDEKCENCYFYSINEMNEKNDYSHICFEEMNNKLFTMLESVEYNHVCDSYMDVPIIEGIPQHYIQQFLFEKMISFISLLNTTIEEINNKNKKS